MTAANVLKKRVTLTKNPSCKPPENPRKARDGYCVAPRQAVQCFSHLNGTIGQYHFAHFPDNLFPDCTGMAPKAFKAVADTGATDEEVALWIQEHSKQQHRLTTAKPSNGIPHGRPMHMPQRFRLCLKNDIDQIDIDQPVPKLGPIKHGLDKFDFAEGGL